MRDGVIRIDDALEAIDCAARPSYHDQQSLFAADMNGDGKVDLSDAAAVFRLALSDPLTRSSLSLAASGSCDPGLSLENRGSRTVLMSAQGEEFSGLLRLELVASGQVVPGQDLPRGAKLLQTRAGGALYVLLDLSGTDTPFRGGEMLVLENQAGSEVRVLSIMSGIPGGGDSGPVALRQTSTMLTPPRQYSLEGNRPNPFNPSTSITYYVPEGEQREVSLDVFDLRGRRVRTLARGLHAPGAWTVVWDGTGAGGMTLPSGVYFCRMSAPGFSAVRKMVLLK